MHWHGLVLLTLAMPSSARRTIGGTYHDAHQQSNALTRALDVSGAVRETLLPQGPGLGTLSRPYRQGPGFSRAGPHRAPKRRAPVRMAVVEPGKFKKGMTIEMDDQIWKVMDFQQSKTARQAAVVRTKLKNLVSGSTTEKTFRLKEAVATANLEKRPATYSYEDNGDLVFYDAETADELRIKKADVLNGDLMPAGLEVTVLQWESIVVDVILPTTVELAITYTEQGVAGDRANPGKKPAELETGASVQVPLFVNTDERILVNTETREYVGRAGA